jgi:3-hydroxybutyryl-CoA dehydrogenase
MQLDDVKKIGMLGGGVMGGGIGQVMAIAGYEVVIRDLTPEILDKTRNTIVETRFGLKRAVEIGKLGQNDYEGVVSRLNYTTRLEDLANCDVIVEAVPEDLELKQRVFKELDGIVKPEAIFASNTSGFAIEDIARDVSPERKQRFAGTHYFSPVPAMKACELVYTPETSQETIDTLKAMVEGAGKVVVMVKDAPGSYGFIVNRIFRAAREEADKIVEAGIATKEDVDTAMITGRNWPVGFYLNQGARSGWL